jgi:hypothetical protein
VALLALGAGLGWGFRAYLAAERQPLPPRRVLHGGLVFAAVILLANVLVVLAVPQQGSPRVFAPTWLVLAIAAAMTGASIRWRRVGLLGVSSGLFAGGALLSLMFSVSVRLQSADFTVRAATIIADRIPDGATVALCDVPRTIVEPAPRGAFAVHDFIYEWSAERALAYYTGRRATIHLAGDLWDRACPPAYPVDEVIRFPELLEGAR